MDSVKELHFPPTLSAPAKAREAVRSGLAGVSGRTVEAAALLVSELVTNSVRHSGTAPDETVILRICSVRPAVRIEVVDWGTGFQFRPRSTPLDRPGGWGLQLVERLARRWGVEEGPPTTVWFELE